MLFLLRALPVANFKGNKAKKLQEELAKFV